VLSRTPRQGEKIEVIIDTETTGLNHAKDEVMELGMVGFTYHNEGRVRVHSRIC
jgi:DNA polymerase III subunit epsilon